MKSLARLSALLLLLVPACRYQTGPITRPERGRLAPAAPGGATGASGEASLLASPTRPVCFDADQGYVETPVRRRADLSPGTTVAGPAIIEEYGSTVPVHPGFTATVDDLGNLLVRSDR